MNFTQRIYAQLVLKQQLQEMHGEQFESFFHRLMGMLHDDYVPVRTHGNLGDMGADGLSLHNRTLHACYSPPTRDLGRLRTKFQDDLRKAREKRAGQFDFFSFVHNDERGAHPEFSVDLVNATRVLRPVKLEYRDVGWITREFRKLCRQDAEELLGCEIPIQDRVYGIGLAELEPLLADLLRRQPSATPLATVPEVNEHKLEYNALAPGVREQMLGAMRYTHLIDEYYEGSLVTDEHDEVAEGFRLHFGQLRDTTEDSEELWLGLEEYVLGNQRATLTRTQLGSVVITHFFERCDVFDAPPAGWSPGAAVPEPRRPR